MVNKNFIPSIMIRSNFFQKELFWGIKLWQCIAFLMFYFFFAFQYWMAIWYTSNGRDNIWKEALLDYFLLKLFFTLPLWWLFFVYWKNKSILFKILLHVITAPIWVFCWFHTYRFIQDLRGAFYLKGDAIWWDVYIPGLVYCLQFAIFHVYDYYLQNEKQKKKEKLLMQAAYNSEVNVLKAQMQPHFLFNTLNSISASVPKEMEHTRELIAKLGDTFRYSLQASEQEFISLQQELDFIKVTLELEKERLKKRLHVIYKVDETLLQTKLPSMLLQPITENAIKHGITPNINGGTITIDIKKDKEKVFICISDTGIGYAGELDDTLFSKGIGLRNTKLRLEKLYGEILTVSKNEPSGLRFSFCIPINYEAEKLIKI
jgi:two-component system, LytTR family, sensor kinase